MREKRELKKKQRKQPVIYNSGIPDEKTCNMIKERLSCNDVIRMFIINDNPNPVTRTTRQDETMKQWE